MLYQIYVKCITYLRLFHSELSKRNFFFIRVFDLLAINVGKLCVWIYSLSVLTVNQINEFKVPEVGFPKSNYRIWKGSCFIFSDFIVKLSGRIKLSLLRMQQNFPGLRIEYLLSVSQKGHININFSLSESAGVLEYSA